MNSKINSHTIENPFSTSLRRRQIALMKNLPLIMGIAISILLISMSRFAFAQQQYDFKDEPWHKFQWYGDTSLFMKVPGGLQLNAPRETGSAAIYVSSNIISEAEWEVSLTMNFNPSSNNYLDINLAGSFEESTGIFSGYYLKVGGANDNVTLRYSTPDSDQLLIEGVYDRIDFSNIPIQVKATHDSTGLWKVFTAVDSGSYSPEGEILHDQLTGSSEFGLTCNYTSTRSDKFFFHFIKIVGEPYFDRLPPYITNLVVADQNSICLSFSETLLSNPSGVIGIETSHFANGVNDIWVSDTLNSIACATFNNPFPNGFEQTLAISGFADSVGNIMSDTIINFTFLEIFPTLPGDIVINELLIDPNPPEDLPAFEFVELWNVSEHPIDLAGWMIRDLRSSTLFEEFVLLPDSLVIVTATGSADSFQAFGATLGIDPWPTLNNSGDSLFLVSSTGEMINSFGYNLSKYDDPKSEGGWSLELVNPFHPCPTSENWAFSNDPSGGSPGRVNSVLSDQADTVDFYIEEISLVTDSLLEIRLSKSVPTKQLDLSRFLLDDNPVKATTDDNDLFVGTILLELTKVVLSNQSYILTVENLEDCYGNSLLENLIQFAFDLTPPAIVDITYPDFGQIDIQWDEAIDPGSLRIENMMVNQLGIPDNFQWIEEEFTLELQYDSLLLLPQELTISMSQITDLSGNTIPEISITSEYYPLPMPLQYELIISEFMADPNTEETLYSHEYVEIYNSSDQIFSLRGMTLNDGIRSSKLKSGFIEPGKYHLIVPPGQYNFDDSGIAVLSNWPSINNDGDKVEIRNQLGDIIHALNFNKSWYQDPFKETGGWSMEMIDLNYPCRGMENWRASIEQEGGTPGYQNSVAASKPDLVGPHLNNAWADAPNEIHLEFNEKLRIESIHKDLFSLKPLVPIDSISVSDSQSNIILRLEDALAPSFEYTLSIEGLSDCSGNFIDESSRVTKVIFPENVTSGSYLILNEILFNPRPYGKDFIEIYNGSSKYLNLKGLSISNGIDTVGLEQSYILGPQNYLALTESPENIMQEYPGSPEEALLSSPMPALPDDAGLIMIMDSDMHLVDSLRYSETLHHPIYEETDGISLERITLEGDSWDQNIWKSAASAMGFATPGAPNSLLTTMEPTGEEVRIEPTVFNPYQTGMYSFVTINYSFSAPGVIGSFEIYSVEGRLVRTLAANDRFGQTGFLTWDGTRSDGTLCGVGHYVLFVRLYPPGETSKTIKKKIIVGTEF